MNFMEEVVHDAQPPPWSATNSCTVLAALHLRIYSQYTSLKKIKNKLQIKVKVLH